jgi:hypothetical protein
VGVDVSKEAEEFLVGHSDAADVGEGVSGAAAYLSDWESVEGVKRARSGGFRKGSFDLAVAVESPAHQHHFLPHVTHQS